MSLEMDCNTKETNQIGLYMLYQAYITNYINILIEFKQNFCKSYTIICEFCNKQLQNLIETDIYYEIKIQDNPIKLLKSIIILIHKPERLNYPFTSITEAFKRVVGMFREKM